MPRLLVALLLAALVTPLAAAAGGVVAVSLSTDRATYHQYDLRPERDAREAAATHGASRVWMTFTNRGSTGVFVWDCSAWTATTAAGEKVAAARSSFDWGYVVGPNESVTCYWDLWDDRDAADPVTGLVPPGDYVVHWRYQTAGGWREALAPLHVESGVEV